MRSIHSILLALSLFSGSALAQEGEAQPPKPASTENTFQSATSSIEARLEKALADLQSTQEAIGEEKVALNREISALEAELREEMRALQDSQRLNDERTVLLGNKDKEIKGHRDEAAFLSSFLQDYLREFETRLHIAERSLFESDIQEVRDELEKGTAESAAVFEKQANILTLSLQRLEKALGGTVFEGVGVDGKGNRKEGEFLFLGPVAMFRSEDGQLVGTAEERLNSTAPSILSFPDESMRGMAAAVVESGRGHLPLDPTLGNAHKIASTEETFLEHVQKGGPVMYPIFGMAGVALLIALYKWLALSFQRKPSQKQLAGLYAAVDRRDQKEALRRAHSMGGPVGRMLAVGAEHLEEPRELIEEVMYEKMLTTRLKLQRMLPFIAICAASAPLLGLLGTVTGIINTFKMITVFGSGDVKSLSGGISEALITTKFGLIVAIPSLLLHAFLSRKARGIIGRMEGAAVAFMNHVSKSEPTKVVVPAQRRASVEPAQDVDEGVVREQVEAILERLLGPLVSEAGREGVAARER